MIAILLAVSQDLEAHRRVAAELRRGYEARDYEAIQALYNEGMARAMPLERTRAFFSRLQEQAGAWRETGDPEADADRARFRARFERMELDVILVLDGEERIAGMWFRPPEPEIPVPERNSMPMGWPLRGEASVFWGGETREENYHNDTRSQRFALDLVARDEAGSSHRGDGATNEDYYVYGREVLAAADGEVVEVIDGVRDNRPGAMNPFSAVGNAVTLRHAEREFTLYAHLVPGSIRVRVGQEVRRGDVLGLCGNSGNSSEPHLHFQLMNSAYLPEATGVRVYFERLRVGDEVREDYAPVRGDQVAPPE